MNGSKSSGTRPDDPFSAFRFQVEIEGLLAGGFSECSGLDLETEVFEYAEGGVNEYLHKFPTRVRQGVIVLRRGIVSPLLWDWYAESRPGRIRLKSGSIVVPDDSGEFWLTWRFDRGWPRKVQGPELDAGADRVAFESVEIAHHGLSLVSGGRLP